MFGMNVRPPSSLYHSEVGDKLETHTQLHGVTYHKTVVITYIIMAWLLKQIPNNAANAATLNILPAVKKINTHLNFQSRNGLTITSLRAAGSPSISFPSFHQLKSVCLLAV
jgi:hypothetical protein